MSNLPAPVDQEAVLKTLSLDLRDPRAQAVILVCQKYELDPVLKHVMVIQGTPYITKAGYFRIAHRSKVFDGIDIMEERETEKQCVARIAVYRKDMARPFVASARFNKSDSKGRDPMDMALARATRRALQQAFDVADVFGNADDVDEVDLVGGGQAPDFSSVTAVVATTPEEDDVMPPFPDEPVAISADSMVGQLVQEQPEPETGEVADELTRRRLKAEIDKLDEEQRSAFLRAWTRAKLGSLQDKGSKPKLLASEVDRAESMIADALNGQNAVHEKRRKHANALMSDLGIKSDEARHEFISTATNDETESTRALLGRQMKAIIEYAETFSDE